MISFQERYRREHNRWYKAVLRWQWRRAGLDAPIVLMVHGFMPSIEQCSSAFQLTALSFEKLLSYLIANGWSALTYEELRSKLYKGNLKRKEFHLTFDDVYDTVYTEALPILEKLQIPFTIFVTKNLVGAQDAKDGRKMITLEHLQELLKSPLCNVGCHGIDHVKFRKYTDSEMRMACAENKQWLIDEFGIISSCFAFPYGRWQEVARRNIRCLADCGFSVGFSALEGTLLSADFTGRHFLPRVNVSETFVEKFTSGKPLKWKDCEGR